MIDIPARFKAEMSALLGDEFQVFLACLASSPVVGLRSNMLKISPEHLESLLPYHLERVKWAEAGFWMPDSDQGDDLPKPGRHPFHAAGLYYLQDPSAMAVAELLEPEPGELILDLCAAPGGKTTHMAALMRNQGAIVANETHPQRVWELAENLERCGVRNAAVSHDTPQRLAKLLGAVFDRVLVDAPCSGEAMFPKSATARREWTPKLVESCSMRQSAILEEAAKLVRPGGVLVYCTCTFNAVENELVISRLLESHPHFQVIQAKSLPGCSQGRPDWLADKTTQPEIKRAVRLWPHRSTGEGLFAAILKRKPDENAFSVERPKPNRFPICPISVHNLFAEFCKTNLSDAQLMFFTQNEQPVPASKSSALNPALRKGFQQELKNHAQLALSGAYLYWIPEEMQALNDLHVVHPGWWLGTVKSGDKSHLQRFEPSHALAMGLTADDCLRITGWSAHDPHVIEYLKGNSLPSPGEDGWVLATVEGYSLGWGKRVKNILKNHYPRGLRWF